MKVNATPNPLNTIKLSPFIESIHIERIIILTNLIIFIPH